jgi:anthranilate synthase component 2
MIDNYDSFTYNLVQYLLTMNQEVEVHRNDQITVDKVVNMKPDCIVVSPGPCTPKEAGISVELIKRVSGQIPLLGICLGMQSIGAAFGADIIRAKRIMHGKASKVSHQQQGLFNKIRSPANVIRYHSLAIDENTLPDCLQITARSDDDNEIMAIRHVEHPTYGVQFHPESIMTSCGKRLLGNFLALADQAG